MSQIDLQDPVDEVATTVSTEYLPLDEGRSYLLIQNRGAVAIYIKFDSAHTSDEGIVLGPGSAFEPLRIPKDAIFIKTGAGTSRFTIHHGK